MAVADPGGGAGAHAHPWNGGAPFKIHHSIIFKHQFITGRPPLEDILHPTLNQTAVTHPALTSHQAPAASVGLAGPGSGVRSALWSVEDTADDATSLPPVRCLPEWRRHRHGCFRALLLDPVQQYVGARELCHQLDPAADLPVLRDPEDVAFVQGTLEIYLFMRILPRQVERRLERGEGGSNASGRSLVDSQSGLLRIGAG